MSPTNPLRLLRQEFGHTQLSLANRIGCTHQIILRLEQGRFSKIPGRPLRYYCELGLALPMKVAQEAEPAAQAFPVAPFMEVTESSQMARLIDSLYFGWIIEQRNVVRQALAQEFDMTWEYSWPLDWPAIRKALSLGSSTASFCRTMCLQDSLVQRFEKDGFNSNKIREALEEVGFKFNG